MGEKRIFSQQTLCKKGPTASDEDENVHPCDDDDDDMDLSRRLQASPHHNRRKPPAAAIAAAAAETSRERAHRLR